MNKKISLGAAISLIAIACAVTFILSTTFSLDIYNKKVQNVKERAEVYGKLDQIDAIVRANYIGDVDEDKLIEAISNGYISILNDSYAKYMTANEHRSYNLKLKGYVEGTGLGVSADENGYVIINEVYEGSSAQDMNIKVGDYITKIEGEDVLVKGTAYTIKALDGKAGTSIKLTIRSEGVDKEVLLNRSEIEVNSVSKREVEKIGVLKISSFSEKTYKQVKSALDDFSEKDISGLVIDLRNNSIGDLKYAVDVLDLILPEVEIYSKTSKNDIVTRVFTSNDDRELRMPIAVLVNSRTSGASELFAASLRDNDKAVLVGSNTSGNGAIQEVFECLDGSGVLLTTSYYKPSKSESYNGVGIKPNYVVNLEDDSVKGLASLDDVTDLQFKKALNYVTTATTD